MVDSTALENIQLSGHFSNLINFSLGYSQQVFVILFLVLSAAIYERYKNINKILEVEILENIHKDNLKALSVLHQDIHELIHVVNKIFSVPLMVLLAYTISAAVFSLYELISVLLTPNVTMQQIGFCLCLNTWLPDWILFTVMLVYFPELAAKEGMRTLSVLRNILSDENCDKNSEKWTRMFIMQIGHSKLRFSCGLFAFEWELLGVVRYNP